MLRPRPIEAAARRCAWRTPTGCTTGSPSPDPRRHSRRSRLRRPAPGSSPGSSTRRASPRTCFSGWWRRRHSSSAASAWPAPASSPASCATPRHGGTTWRWPGSATPGPARSTCTRCCRCRRTSCGAGQTIRSRWPGCGRTGAPPTPCATSRPRPPPSRTAVAGPPLARGTWPSLLVGRLVAVAGPGGDRGGVSGAALRPTAQL